ncbi:exonuclease domain-containing protein [Timonella sp. A28]|uniref:exonuclease domain-containing protein n=1 Tax=Timonella sp. A28 TaxID=3442640 RepID=UPI003EBC501A
MVANQAWLNGPFVGFDTETTGVSTDNDRIVTAAIVVRTPEETTIQTWLIDPGIPIPVEASNIHGITTEHAQEHGQQPVEALEEIAELISGYLRGGAPLVAFNATFDVTILNAELTRHGLPTLDERIGRPTSPVIDPLVLDRALDRYRRGKRKLVDLCSVYGIQETGTLHTADADVVATLDVLARMLQKYPDVARMGLPELHTYQATAHKRWAHNFNAFLARQGNTDRVETTWLAHEEPANETLF